MFHELKQIAIEYAATIAIALVFTGEADEGLAKFP